MFFSPILYHNTLIAQGTDKRTPNLYGMSNQLYQFITRMKTQVLLPKNFYFEALDESNGGSIKGT